VRRGRRRKQRDNRDEKIIACIHVGSAVKLECQRW
jgi:hypothetical protein